MKMDFGAKNIKSYKERDKLYFHILDTKDGSPTCFTSEEEKGEAETMHSSQGAFEETEYIYGTAISQAIKSSPENLSFLNIGVGIGYNELSIVCHCIKQNISPENCYINSYELYSELSEALSSFYSEDQAHPFLNNIFERVLTLYSSYFDLDKDEIKTFIKSILANSNWKIHGPIQIGFAKADTLVSCILFDAYSANTDPHLWAPEFLDEILSRSAEKCVFASYAATGDLKRALKKANYEIPKRKGFAFKRESTLASKP